MLAFKQTALFTLLTTVFFYSSTTLAADQSPKTPNTGRDCSKEFTYVLQDKGWKNSDGEFDKSLVREERGYTSIQRGQQGLVYKIGYKSEDGEISVTNTFETKIVNGQVICKITSETQDSNSSDNETAEANQGNDNPFHTPASLTINNPSEGTASPTSPQSVGNQNPLDPIRSLK